MALSTPNTTEASINNFPFYYQDKLRVYNRGDVERTFQINIDAPYSDVRKWLSVDEAVFTLPPDSSKQITFNIFANEGYGGEYLVTFTPTMLVPEEEVTGGAGAHVGVGVDFVFMIHVPPDVGEKSLGAVHPPEEVIEEPVVDDTITPQNTSNQDAESTSQTAFEEPANLMSAQLMSTDNFLGFLRDNWLYASIALGLAIAIPLLVNRRRRSQRMCG
jgi:hypothetical protein